MEQSKREEEEKAYSEKMRKQFYKQAQNDDQYERKGDYFQCVKCNFYTVHISKDNLCLNPKCPSNLKLYPPRQR